MIEKIKKYQRLLFVVLIVICIGCASAIGISYVKALQNKLQNQAIQNVMTVTLQQQQAFDNFISQDTERVHSFATYFANSGKNPEEIQEQLTIFNDIDATYAVICLDEGLFCCNAFEDILPIDEENLETYLGLTGTGIRDSYIGPYTGIPRFCYYETFTFSNGHKGLIQKSYDRSRISETFSLSFYNNQGFSYVINQNGDILLRAADMLDNHFYENILDLLTDTQADPEDIEQFRQALNTRATGSIIFTGKLKDYVYSYVPMENAENWYLVSIVPMDAITDEANHLLLDSQKTVGLLILILLICVLLILSMFLTGKYIKANEQDADYQTQLFDIFISYLSRNTNDIYMMLDHETEILEYVSPNVKQVLGVDPKDVIDVLKASDMTSDPESAEAYYKQLQSMIPGETVLSRTTERINPQTGEHRYFQENAYCAVVHGRIKRMAYISDRTKERQVQANLTEALQMAKIASEAKSTFLSSISHDIRTPMNAIIGFLTLMRDEVHNPETVMEYNKRIDAASQHLLGLINDVLDLNKIESGSATLNIVEFTLAEIIDGLNTIIRPQTNAKNQTFDISVSQLTYEHLSGDKLRINQILINLLSNAVKYTPENGTIELQIEELPQTIEDYSRIRFTVSDNGLGMSEDYLKVIFDPFTREETKNTRQIQGTGLGRPITKSLVELMGGSIHVESEPGKGSTFTVELTLHIQEQNEEPAFWKDHNITKILVVDDEEEICLNIIKAMSQTGVATDYSTNGAKATQMLLAARKEGSPYSLVLLDWKMPNLSGLETARLIRENYPDKILIFLLTAYDWSDIEQEASKSGVNHFMPKPFFVSTLKEAVHQITAGDEKKADDTLSNVVRGKHILVVDDMKANQFILSKILGTLGARCDIAGNGQEAVEMFEAAVSDTYDLILMDVQMPVVDGYTATGMIRGSSHPLAKTIPIIAMTANAFVEDIQNALDAGMDAHVAKPVQRNKLLATIQEVMKKYENP